MEGHGTEKSFDERIQIVEQRQFNLHSEVRTLVVSTEALTRSLIETKDQYTEAHKELSVSMGKLNDKLEAVRTRPTQWGSIFAGIAVLISLLTVVVGLFIYNIQTELRHKDNQIQRQNDMVLLLIESTRKNSLEVAVAAEALEHVGRQTDVNTEQLQNTARWLIGSRSGASE